MSGDLQRAVSFLQEARELEKRGLSEPGAAHALNYTERAMTLHLKAARYAASTGRSSEFQSALAQSSERHVVMLNAAAVQAFRELRFDEADAHLASAQRFLEGSASQDYFPNDNPTVLCRLKSTTLNNFGCLERRRGNFESALKYMKKAVSVFGDITPISLLNMSAVCLQLRRTDEAVSYSQKALDALRLGGSSSIAFPGLVAVAHHNIAIAMESSDPNESHGHYKKALEAARKELGNASSTTVAIQKNLSMFVQLRRAGNQPRAEQPPGSSSDDMHLSLSKDDVLHSTDMSTAVLMETHRGYDTAPSSPIKPQPPSSRVQSAGEKATSLGDVDGPRVPRRPDGPRQGERGFQRQSLAGTATAISGKGTQGLGPPLPQGIAPGEEYKDEEEKRKEDIVTYMYGRLKDLVRHEDWMEQRYQAAVKIQCMVRIFFARRSVAVLGRKRRHRTKRRLERERRAAVSVINFLRGIVQKRKAVQAEKRRREELQKHRVFAAIKIQSLARRWLAQEFCKRLRRYYLRYHHSVERIQCWMRCMLSLRKAKRMRHSFSRTLLLELDGDRKMYGATLIQKCYRAHRGRIGVLVMKGDVKAARELDWQSNRTHAAKRIQRLWRGYAVRRLTSDTLRRLKKRRIISTRTLARKHAASSIQRIFRGYLCRRAHPEVRWHLHRFTTLRQKTQERNATICIQKYVRRFLAKLHVGALRNDNLQRMQARLSASRKPFMPPVDWKLVRRERMV